MIRPAALTHANHQTGRETNGPVLRLGAGSGSGVARLVRRECLPALGNQRPTPCPAPLANQRHPGSTSFTRLPPNAHVWLVTDSRQSIDEHPVPRLVFEAFRVHDPLRRVAEPRTIRRVVHDARLLPQRPLDSRRATPTSSIRHISSGSSDVCYGGSRREIDPSTAITARHVSTRCPHDTAICAYSVLPKTKGTRNPDVPNATANIEETPYC